MINKLSMRWLLYILSFFALCIQTPIIRSMSGASIRRIAAVRSIPVRTMGSMSVTARIAAAYNKYVHGRYEITPSTSLEKIILSSTDVVTQTQGHLVLHKESVEKSYAQIMKKAPYFNLKNKHIHYEPHQWNYYFNSLFRFFNREKYDAKIIKALSDAHNKEIEEVRKGNIVAYHGQAWNLHFAADIYKELHNLSGKNPMRSDYIPLRFSEKPHPDDLFFMNVALFNNTNSYSCNSFNYFVNDVSGAFVTLPYIFEASGFGHCYKKYKENFDELEKLHRKATVNGNLLLLSFTPEQAEKWIDKDCFFYINLMKDRASGKKISCKPNHEQYLNTWLPDGWTFTMNITPEILNPETGPKIYSFNTADPEIMAQYETKKRELFDRIKADREKQPL